ncbi:hypothetical protein B296_00041464 [Ensete ventricosum]|uniref:Uncharacterized protein n=1 Tax=Ensete ventricosum TaxID=4639 RepID=A0A426Z9D9_ENSVE|nr:hypothetical protein B296_00041464 [Ensete ventricosum]
MGAQGFFASARVMCKLLETRPLRAELPSFASVYFHSSVGSSVVDTYTKAMVLGGGGRRRRAAPTEAEIVQSGLMRMGGRSTPYAGRWLNSRPICPFLLLCLAAFIVYLQ